MESHHQPKRVAMQPSVSFPAASTPAGAYSGSETANNHINREIFEKLRTGPAGVRFRVHQGYKTPSSSSLFSSAEGSSTGGSGVFEDEITFLKRVNENRVAFARTQSQPVQTRLGELQPLANLMDTEELERTQSNPRAFSRSQSAASNLGMGTAPTEMTGGVLDTLLKRSREDLDNDDKDAVLARWAEDEERIHSSPSSTQDSSASDISTERSSNDHRSISTLPKRSFMQTKSLAPGRAFPAHVPGQRASAFGQTGGASATAVSHPVGSKEMQTYLTATTGGAPVREQDLEVDGPWRRLDFSQFATMDEGF